MFVAKDWLTSGLCGLGVAGSIVYGLVSAQTSDAQGNPPSTTGSTPQEQQQCLDPALPVCSDGQVVAILQAANQGEIDVAKAVIGRVQDPSVQGLAQTIINDHSAALDKVDQLITSLNIEPIENDNSEELAESADMTIASLQSETGRDLEKSYVAHEIFDHIQTIGTADHLLGPSARNPELKATIQALRPTLVKHLQLASEAQRSISGACGGQSSQTEGNDAGTAPQGY